MLAENKVKIIGVMTSGGDAPGMNAAIRAVVYEGIRHGLKVLGIRRGYSGLLQEDIREMDEKSVADIIRLGGTVLETSRCPEMMTDEGQAKAAEVCRKYKMDGLIVIGGDGSFRGAQKLSAKGMGIIGVPGTIDGDIACTDYTIGFDTAVNAAMEAIDRIHDTGASHECCSIVEVMGRHNGSIALWTGIAGGAEMVCIPERRVPTADEIAEDVRNKRRQGRNDYILVNAEGVGHTQELRQEMEKDTGIHTRQTVLGFLQRGGVPTCKERVFASVMGTKAVDLLLEGRTNRVVVHRDGRFSDVSIDEVLSQEVYFADDLYQCMKAVCGRKD